VKEARFPLVKTLGSFAFEEAPQLDKRLIGELAAETKSPDTGTFSSWAKAGAGKPILPQPWE
jgi:hypothetical protein